MSGYSRISIHASEQLIADIDNWGKEHGMNRSEAARFLLDLSLDLAYAQQSLRSAVRSDTIAALAEQYSKLEDELKDLRQHVDAGLYAACLGNWAAQEDLSLNELKDLSLAQAQIIMHDGHLNEPLGDED